LGGGFGYNPKHPPSGAVAAYLGIRQALAAFVSVQRESGWYGEDAPQVRIPVNSAT